MTRDMYEKLRQENVRKYGTDINRYGPTLLDNLYSDRTHFIYELLQNAEDACERARKVGLIDEFKVSFRLFPGRLEMRHNGIPFDENDVRGICALVEGTKSRDLSQIGKFGIGFKSVYAYTISPEVYSGGRSFCIRNYVQPFSIEPRADVEEGETLLVIPFNHSATTAGDAFFRIGGRLKDLGLITLLFLRNINALEWEIHKKEKGSYRRETKNIKKYRRRVTLLSQVGSTSDKKEEWLVFERPITKDKRELKVEVGFRVGESGGGKETIVPVSKAKLAAFFLTDTITDFKFVIQGPYETTPPRNDIYDNEWNRNLIKETAILVAESIPKMKELELLNIKFLNVLPIESEEFQNASFFKPVYDKVKEKLASDEELLPAYNGGYVSAKRALLARGKGLHNLLSSNQLETLFDRQKWLDQKITRDTTPELRTYLMEELNISEIGPEKFAKAFNEDFIKKQADEWITRFYAFLIYQPALWQDKGDHYWEKEGILRSKPIIRLTDGTYVSPFDSEGNPLAYLPAPSLEEYFSTVKKEIIRDEKAMKFLQELGLRKPDRVDGIKDKILSKYQGDSSVSLDENRKDLKLISETLRKLSDSGRKNDLLQTLRQTPFLVARKITDPKLQLKRPGEIYLGEVYTGEKDIEIFFEENAAIWLLYPGYKEVLDVRILKEDIKCMSEIKVSYEERTDWEGNVTLWNYHGSHRRGIEGFDPGCEIEGLEYALRNITVEKAKVIWGILKKHYKKISGIIETATHKDYSNSKTEEEFSMMGELLEKYPWLPDEKGNFHRPSEILLSELPKEFSKESLEAKYVADKLKFRTDVEQQLLERLSPAKRKQYEIIDRVCQIVPKEKIDRFLEKMAGLIEENLSERDNFPIQRIAKKFEESLMTLEPSPNGSTQEIGWSGLTPEQEQQIHKEYGHQFSDRLQKMQLINEPKITKGSKIIDSIGPREFLLEQYCGRCQVCNTHLDLGPNKKPYFEIFRLVEPHGKNVWANMEFNILCLCPNCHALLKHGSKDLRNVEVVANKVLREEMAPEPIDERRGDFYIVRIRLVGKDKELFYSPAHMNKLVAFFEQSLQKEGSK